jgi:hypothetical protein
MREIAMAGGGALLIDPRSDSELVAALDSLLTDDALHARLSAQAATFPTRSWDDYAAETWAYLAEFGHLVPGDRLATAEGR